MLRRVFIPVILGLASLFAFVARGVLGYAATPTVGAGAWEVVDVSGPSVPETVVRARAAPDRFFAKIMSVFSRPSLTYSCDYPAARWRVDWQEPVALLTSAGLCPQTLMATVVVPTDGRSPRVAVRYLGGSLSVGLAVASV